MFNRVVNLFKRPAASKVIEPKGATADSVRKYAKAASDIHRGMNLHSRMPLVCSSIDAKKFAEFARVELVKRDGVKQGASAKWTFKLL